MPENEKPFEWTAQRELAAKLAAEDKLSDAAICEKVGISEVCLWKWKNKPEFKARIDSYVSAYRSRIRSSGIAIIENRIARLADIQRRMEMVIEARAKAYASEDIPGGSSGLVAKEIKGIGSKEDFQVVEEYRVDTGLLREHREYLKQVSQELGQWAEAGNEGRNQALDFLKVLDQQMKAGPAKTEEEKPESDESDEEKPEGEKE